MLLRFKYKCSSRVFMRQSAMEPVNFVFDKITGITRSGQDFVNSLLHRRQKPASRNPIEILKRLQREAFSDIMKLRDRQDKVERILSFSKTSRGSPFGESSTFLRGEVDAIAAILLLGDVKHNDAVAGSGIRTGIDSRFTFNTTIREKDTLQAEFVASHNGTSYSGGDISGSALSLSKVLYVANVCDWFSVTAIPLGSQFRDLRITTSSAKQRKGLTCISSPGPPLLNQHHGGTVGVTVKKSNVTTSVAHSMLGFGAHPSPDGISQCFSTFGQIDCQLTRGMQLSLLGLHQVPKSSIHHPGLGPLAIPLVFKNRNKAAATIDSTAQQMQTSTSGAMSTGSIAVKLESELDEDTKIEGWVEMKNSNIKQLQWTVNMYDDSKDETGWGLSVSGMVEGGSDRNHFQAESYLKLNLGRNLCLKPGVVYAMNGNSRMFSLMLGSNWSF